MLKKRSASLVCIRLQRIFTEIHEFIHELIPVRIYHDAK